MYYLVLQLNALLFITHTHTQTHTLAELPRVPHQRHLHRRVPRLQLPRLHLHQCHPLRKPQAAHLPWQPVRLCAPEA